MVDPIIGGGVVAAVAATAYGVYRKRRGGDEGEDEPISIDHGDPFDSNDAAEDPAYQDRDRDDYEDLREEQPDPTPDAVTEKDSLADVKGIGEDRAADLVAEGFESPADLYYAADENLVAINGIGEYTVGQIREDIGSVDDDPNGESDEESQAGEDTDSDTDDQAKDEESSSPETDQESDDTGSDSEDQTAGTGNDSDDE